MVVEAKLSVLGVVEWENEGLGGNDAQLVQLLDQTLFRRLFGQVLQDDRIHVVRPGAARLGGGRLCNFRLRARCSSAYLFLLLLHCLLSLSTRLYFPNNK